MNIPSLFSSQVHRACMVSVVTLGLIAYIVIIIHVGGYLTPAVSDFPVVPTASQKSIAFDGVVVLMQCATNIEIQNYVEILRYKYENYFLICYINVVFQMISK